MTHNLKIITSTIRPARKSIIIGRWATAFAQDHPDFETELLDIGAINLPLMSEPQHPMMQQYEHEHTKQWSAKIDEADAFIFVTAEYDHSYPAPLKNALEYLVQEWAYKPAGIVSYSIGAFAGVRAVEDLKKDLLSLRTVSIAQAVNIPTVQNFITETGEFIPDENMEKNATAMLDELQRWTKGLNSIRKDI